MQLLILAAGMGSRFGGLKQIEPIGPNGEFIIDYSIYDAIKTGFSKVIFIIKEENYEIFKETIGKRVEKYIPVEYVFQKMEDVPSFVQVPKNRVKPWGTGQALYAARKVVTEPFLVINSDDFYGRDAFIAAKEFLEKERSHEYATICYKVVNTLTKNGSVTRGVTKGDENGRLVTITESLIEQVDGEIIGTPLNGGSKYKIYDDTIASVNLMAFDLSIFTYLEKKITEFFKQNANNLDKCEIYISELLSEAYNEGFADVYVITTDATWRGVTYKEDKDDLKAAILELINKGEYPNKLWR